MHRTALYTEEEAQGIVEGVPVHHQITVLIAKMDFINMVEGA